MEKITVLTPAYNRADTLAKCYRSLVNQTDKRFNWLIIDDGSIDNTAEIVQNFIAEKKIEINYIFKKNGGKHTAINRGVKDINSLMTIILDSDDYLTVDAISQIFKNYNKNIDLKNICGFTFLKSYPNGKIMGQTFPREGIANYIDWRVNGVVSGEQCDVFFTNCLKEFPFSEYEGEKFIGESTVWIKMAEKYDMVFINKVIYIAEYLENGLTHLGRKMRILYPQGGMEYSKLCMNKRVVLKRRIKSAVLYNSYCFISKKKILVFVDRNYYPMLTILMIPIGYLLSKYWSIKYK